MLVVIFRFRGERYEMSFLPSEHAAATAIANKYGTTVIQPGALVNRTSMPVRRRKVG